MRAGAGGVLIRHAADWRAITSLNAYRSLIAFGLVTLLMFGVTEQWVGLALPDVFRAASLLYLMQCALGLFAARSRWPSLRAQVLLACAVDVSFFVTLAYASNGVSGGLGMLLITPVAAAGMLLPAREASLLAACAAIGIIGQEGWRSVHFIEAEARFAQAGILGSVFFITAGVAHWLAQRVRVSEALAAERASEVRDLATLNRLIIEQMEIGAVVVNGARQVDLINNAAIRMLELDAGDHAGRPLRRLSAPLEQALARWREGQPGRTEIVRSGSHSLLPLFSTLGGGNSSSILIFIEDALRQSEQAQQLKLMSIGRMAASIAHEIRNPLGAISHAGQLLAESQAMGPQEHRMLDIIRRHSRRIDGIVSSVLGLSRRSQTSRRTLALHGWLYDAIDDYLTTNEDPPDFDMDDFDESIQVEFDPDHLRQILFNLWDNAVRHARRDGVELTIALSGHSNRSRSDRFCLDVRDNGPGIGTEIRDQVMEPFFSTNREGTGLGLHICGELCEANGAQLIPVADSHGACFRIVFAHTGSAGVANATASLPSSVHEFH